ncbi:MAG: hypothetical protein ACP5HG_11725 [Anaerolineae bacterium]
MHTSKSQSHPLTVTTVVVLAAGLGAVLALVTALPGTGVRGETVTPLPAVQHTGDRLGTCYANYIIDDEPLAPLAYAAGSRWDRVDFAWDRIRPEEDGPYHFEPYEELVSSDTDYGLNVVGILLWTPDWAAADCVRTAHTPVVPDGSPLFPTERLSAEAVTSQAACPPKNLDLPWDRPDNYWGNFVYETVSHFDDVRVWEIWNEPDLYTDYWRGSVADYANLLRIGYQAAKAANPDVTVLFAGLAYWANRDYYVHVLDELAAFRDAADHNGFFDVMSLHLYSNIYTIGPVAAEIQANMTERVGPHPIWLTEAGVPLWDESVGGIVWPKTNRATAEEAAAYVIEAFAEARAAGIERFFFFRTHDDFHPDDDGMSEGLFGLIRDNGTLRPAYVAYQVAAMYLHGENQVTGPLTHDGVRRVSFWGTPQGRVDVLWNTGDAPLTHTHPAVLPSATVVTHRGITTAVEAVSDTFTLSLEPATANTASDESYLIGGPPLLVIQKDTVAPTSTLRPLPSLVYSHSVTLTWDAADRPAGSESAASGYWYAEVERAPAAEGPWSRILDWRETSGVTSTLAPLPESGTWYFRTRVRDRTGNWGPQPAGPEALTRAVLTRTVTLSVSTYLDHDSSGTWDPGEPATTTTGLSWETAQGEVIDASVGATWQVTHVVKAGDYVVKAQVPGYLLAAHPIPVQPGPDPLLHEITIGLLPINARAYLPLIQRGN